MSIRRDIISPHPSSKNMGRICVPVSTTISNPFQQERKRLKWRSSSPWNCAAKNMRSGSTDRSSGKSIPKMCNFRVNPKIHPKTTFLWKANYELPASGKTDRSRLGTEKRWANFKCEALGSSAFISRPTTARISPKTDGSEPGM